MALATGAADSRLRGEPRERDRSNGRVVCSGEQIERVEHREAALVEVAVVHAGRSRAVDLLAVGPVLAAEEPAGEREVGKAGEAVALAQGRQLALVVLALHQVVVRLQRHVGGHPVALADPQRLLEALGAVVRGGRVADHPVVDQRTERSERLLERRVGVVLVRVVEVDAIDPQSLQRGLGAVEDRRRRQARQLGRGAHLRAITSCSRLPRAAIQRPMIRSDSPAPPGPRRP